MILLIDVFEQFADIQEREWLILHDIGQILCITDGEFTDPMLILEDVDEPLFGDLIFICHQFVVTFLGQLLQECWLIGHVDQYLMVNIPQRIEISLFFGGVTFLRFRGAGDFFGVTLISGLDFFAIASKYPRCIFAVRSLTSSAVYNVIGSVLIQWYCLPLLSMSCIS